MARTTINDYYVKAFQKLENKGKDTWNWSAMFFASAWLLYRKMYLYAFLLVALDVCVLLLANAVTTIDIASNIMYGLGIIEMLLLGYFGNRLYYRAVQKKIAAGYHLLDSYHPYSISMIAILIIMFTVYNGLFWTIPAGNETLYSGMFDITMFAFIVIYASADWIANRLHKRKQKNVSNTEISEQNIRQYLTYSNRNHIPGQIAVVLGFFVAINMVVGSIGWHIDKMPKEQIVAAIEKMKTPMKSEAPSTVAKSDLEKEAAKK